ncbi:MAG: amino acid adenylation domain-containing protein [Caldilineaceae bacterium]
MSFSSVTTQAFPKRPSYAGDVEGALGFDKRSTECTPKSQALGACVDTFKLNHLEQSILGQNKTDELMDARDALLDLLLAEEELLPPAPAGPTTARAAGESTVCAAPLTPAQERIWFLEQMTPGASTLLIPVAVRLQLPVDEAILEHSIAQLWQRHRSLRLTFEQYGDAAQQRLGDCAPPPLAVVDLRHEREAARVQRVQSEMMAESQHGFQLDRGPLIRTKLLRLQENESIFLLTLHHIIADGWSVDLLLRELVQIYMATRQGNLPDLPTLPIDYLEYAAHQQQAAEAGSPHAQERARQLVYWKEKLAGPLPTTELSPDFVRPSEQTFAGAQHQLTLAPSLHHALTRLAQSTGTTLYMLLLAGFKALLQRHIGAEEIIVGSPVAGRNRPELEKLVGLFLNTLVLRTDLAGNPTFLELLERVRATCIEAYANQDIPFERLIIELLSERTQERTPFFQIFFNMQRQQAHLDLSQMDLGNGKISYVEQPSPGAKFDMTLYVDETSQHLALTLLYNKALFHKARMADLLQQYHLLLQQIVTNPARPLNDYSLVTERARILLPDPAARLSKRWEGTIFARLDQWAETQPDALAVIDPNVCWSYRELSANSNRLARFLQSRGVQKGHVIAIYGQRRAALVCAIMGVHKAGAATLILDPAYPTARQQQYIDATEPTGWLTFAHGNAPDPAVQESATRFAAHCQMALPDAPHAVAQMLAAYSADPLAVAVGPDDLASVTFTSGSTGQPKGVMGRHGSLSHFYPWMTQHFALTRADRFSLLSGLAHDPLQRDIFTPLWVGAQIHAPDGDELWQPGYLSHWLAAQEITVAHLIPSMVHVLALASTEAQLPALRQALFVGESLTRRHVEQVRQLAPNVNIINLYGTSETQRAVSYHVVSEQTAATAPGHVQPKAQIPLGMGMPGAQLLVLNAQQQSAGIGEVGELYMQSPHLALGYWRDDALTAQKFISNPLGEGALYRTGDLGRYLPDGQVEFAGRADQQVNIRGYRVELAEIEAALAALPCVSSAVVVAVRVGADAQQVVGYCVARTGQLLEPSRIREQLGEKLPAHMAPTQIMVVDEIPLTPNGKIDYAALPVPDASTARPERYRPPRDDVEQPLAQMWQHLLDVEAVGLDDNFFRLGGHSILAVQLFSRMRERFGVDLNIGLLFRYPTLEELAKAIKEQQAACTSRSVPTSAPASAPALPDDTGNLVCIQCGDADHPTFFCVHGAGGHVLFMEEWKPYFDKWSIWGFESLYVDGFFDTEATIEQIAAAYARSLRKVRPHGPYFLGGYSGGGILAYEMARQLQADGEEIELLVLLDTYHPAIRSAPSNWSTRMKRLALEPVQTLSRLANENVFHPLRRWYLLNRYVKRNERVPIENRQPLLAHFFIQAKSQYAPQPTKLPILLVRSRDVTPTYRHAGPLLGWDSLIDNLHVTEVPGNHFSLVKAPGVRFLAQELKETYRQLVATPPIKRKS